MSISSICILPRKPMYRNSYNEETTSYNVDCRYWSVLRFGVEFEFQPRMDQYLHILLPGAFLRKIFQFYDHFPHLGQNLNLLYLAPIGPFLIFFFSFLISVVCLSRIKV